MRRFLQLNSDHLVFVLLVLIAIAGRWDRLDWNFTPVAAASLFAGFYFRNRLVAALVPLSALAISDFAEPLHNNRWVLLTVWAAMLLPAMLGPWLRNAATKWQRSFRGLVVALLPSLMFFLSTNFVVWLTGSGLQYSPGFKGLAECYLAAVPFYLNMLAGDLFYMGLMFAAWALVTQASRTSRVGATS